MIQLPIFATCRCCTFFAQCSGAFPASGVCPHPKQAQKGEEHPLPLQAGTSHLYAALLNQDAGAVSIFQRWRRGLVPTNDDFNSLWSLMFDGFVPHRAEQGSAQMAYTLTSSPFAGRPLTQKALEVFDSEASRLERARDFWQVRGFVILDFWKWDATLHVSSFDHHLHSSA